MRAYPRTRHPPARSTRNSRRARPRACSRKGATAPSSAGEPPSAAAAIRGRPRAPRRAGPLSSGSYHYCKFATRESAGDDGTGALVAVAGETQSALDVA